MLPAEPERVVEQLIAAALVLGDGSDLVARAGRLATAPRDRQLIAIADAHLRGDRELVDVLARDHLVDHPDSVLVALIAAASRRSTATSVPNSIQNLDKETMQ